jgi:hypothetical protein
LSDGYFKAIDTTAAPQIRWYDFQGVLQAQHSITLSLKAKVTQSGTNKAMATNGDITTDWAEASVRVKTKEPLSCSISPNTVNVNFHNYSSKDVKVTCSTDAGKKANIQIDCGNGTKSSVMRSTSSSSMTCTYKESDFTKDSKGEFNPIFPKCTITYDSETVNCQGSVAGTGDGIGFCGDGLATDWEDCDCTSRYNSTTKTCDGDNVVFNEDRGIKEKDYRGGTCKNCKLKDTEITPVPCWDVNA